MSRESGTPAAQDTFVAADTLIVDDDRVHAQMLVEALEEAGWNASAEWGLAEALARLRQGNHGLVVSEVRIGREDGLELLRAIRALARPVPVILMSASGTRATRLQALAAGAFGYLQEPFALDELVALVARALGAIAP
jgi:DNA-binding NtrC family response regulator